MSPNIQVRLFTYCRQTYATDLARRRVWPTPWRIHLHGSVEDATDPRLLRSLEVLCVEAHVPVAQFVAKISARHKTAGMEDNRGNCRDPNGNIMTADHCCLDDNYGWSFLRGGPSHTGHQLSKRKARDMGTSGLWVYVGLHIAPDSSGTSQRYFAKNSFSRARVSKWQVAFGRCHQGVMPLGTRLTSQFLLGLSRITSSVH